MEVALKARPSAMRYFWPELLYKRRGREYNRKKYIHSLLTSNKSLLLLYLSSGRQHSHIEK